MKAYPVQFEIYDEADEPVASIKCFDDVTANIEITALITATSWPEIAATIHECLLKMELK